MATVVKGLDVDLEKEDVPIGSVRLSGHWSIHQGAYHLWYNVRFEHEGEEVYVASPSFYLDEVPTGDIHKTYVNLIGSSGKPEWRLLRGGRIKKIDG